MGIMYARSHSLTQAHKSVYQHMEKKALTHSDIGWLNVAMAAIVPINKIEEQGSFIKSTVRTWFTP